MADDPISFTLNGAPVTSTLPGDTPLVHALRQDLHCRGVRLGCGEGQCGACTVLLDQKAVQSCDTPLWSVAGRAVTTIEGLARDGAPGPLQALFLDLQAAQCGFCINGVIVTATAMLAAQPRPTREEMIATLDERHLCRCGAHARILRAIDAAMGETVAGDAA